VDAAEDDMNEINLAVLACAIGHHETGNRDDAKPLSGARGRYQFQRQLWQNITHEPFELAHSEPIATAVMIRHLEWLRRHLRTFPSLERSGVGILALGWVAGPQAVRYVFATDAQKDAAKKIEETYHRFVAMIAST
jgi:hypothetical protein